jgi:hypothetical protein
MKGFAMNLKSVCAMASLGMILLSSVGARADRLTNYCELNHGQLLDRWQCPASGAVRSGPFCRVLNNKDEELIFNGCTNVNGAYADLFFKVCVEHDLCYHNEPGATGSSKADCDNRLYKNAIEICNRERPGQTSCALAAHAFYWAVHVMGESSWRCSKNNASYPSLENL